ncbi:MAG TPA: M28 family metallopeptidase [Eubacteriales bacterium]|nr:M28 family metallopeptidase [Eubacteriales bacterium]
MDAKRAFSLLKKIGFTRMGGTNEELQAANILVDEIKSIGGQASIEEFDVNSQTIKTQKLFADGVEYEVVAYGNSGNTAKDGLTAPFYYMEYFTDNDIAKFEAKGKIVLTNSYMSLATYKSLADTGCVGFITFGGDVLDKKSNSDLMTRELRQPLKDYKTLPGVNMRAADAMKLVKQKPKNITIKIEQDEFQAKSRNVVAEIKGELDEVIVFTAHYDSVNFSKGVYDNGSGSVLLMEMYRHYMKVKPRRTLRFIWTGCEERGLLGSKAYVAAHEQELSKIVLCINVDVGAPVLGTERIVVTAEESLTHAIDYMAKELGHAIQVKSDIYSSDAIPFADKGIPGVNFMRDGAPGCNHIHDRNDTMFYLSSDALKSTGEFLEKFSDRYINSYVFPVPRKIPDDIKKKVDKYLNPIKDLL